ncbi:hypothetical protein EJ05DRAFT_306901 [Pseudovirgaria hyperparasitica]|uniref:F-box domain-containing protein n=1 Tax=Pseudovirgaria hyperparasitica TaxID=470096 RepID=A0A6A6WCX1_9PEZI|nr:uncharacterized protein EJ05DRAFT_306901 [Pseudovirgaria hyperparasitica]KAF2759696.1 hypothetical protein EJ05DRAFT_306901 [Pseudovirgaria hyperparasitica]
MSDTPPFLRLPGEIRNIIYIYSFNIEFHSRTSVHEQLKFTRRPKGLSNLFRVNKQIHQEATTLFYKDFFPKFQLENLVTYMDIYRFVHKVPVPYRGLFMGHITRVSIDGQRILDQVGLHSKLPWVCTNDVANGDSRTTVKQLRGDCFLCTRFTSFSSTYGSNYDYDRITLTGHLGRIQWTKTSPPKIHFKAPQRIDWKIDQQK